MLGGLGVAGDVEPGVTFVEDIGDLVEEVVDDLYLRRFHWVDGRPDFDRAQALRIGRVAIENPATPIEPRAAPAGHRRRRCGAGWRRRSAPSSTSASAGWR